MKKMNLLILTSILSIHMTSQAETVNAQQGLDKLNQNVENSESNLNEYQKNLDIVNKNLVEIQTAKNKIQSQKEKVTQEIVLNNESLKKLINQEKELQNLIAQEEVLKQKEDKQIQQLEALLAKAKENASLRMQNINDYKNQMNLAAEEKKAWKNRESDLRTQETNIIQNLRNIASDEATWTSKQKAYQSHVNKWTNESQKHKKIYETYQSLKESKN